MSGPPRGSGSARSGRIGGASAGVSDVGRGRDESGGMGGGRVSGGVT
eukprot:CAMPEP_0113918012 /NCGR_PEP_ID=MMETSP0780_2-20120614/33077_1 /TAXON_ID=652834 /ORGANISM="Palpitomonas bilix" /LENGTH=46 /DNA_ID=CAMNT_0000917697 /DNA_START=86 /DNA_END=222 /DNA_ORIENTATION=+ /assembly_acc=CAM_ASM_000599